MKYYPDITEPKLHQTTPRESGRISTYGPPVGWDARLPTHPMGSGYYSWLDATINNGIISETYASDDEPQTLYYEESEETSPTVEALSQLNNTLSGLTSPLTPLSDFTGYSTNIYLGDHYPSYQEVLNHTYIHNHTHVGGAPFHTILGPQHTDRNNVAGFPDGFMAYTDGDFGKFGIDDDDNKVPYSCSTGGGTRGFQNGYPLSDVHKTGETQSRTHELCFSGSAVNTVTVTDGVAEIDLTAGAGAVAEGCWKLSVTGTGSGTLDSGDWYGPIVLTIWGRALDKWGNVLDDCLLADSSRSYDMSDDRYKSRALTFYEEDSESFLLSWDDSNWSTGSIYVDGVDHKLKYDVTSYTDDCEVFFYGIIHPKTEISI